MSSGQAAVTLTWSPGDIPSQKASFSIDRSDDGVSGWSNIGTTSTGVFSYTHYTSANLAGVLKYFRVKAQLANWTDSSYSSVISVTYASTLL